MTKMTLERCLPVASAIMVIVCVAAPAVSAEQDCIRARQLVRQGVELSDASAREEQFYTEAIELCSNINFLNPFAELTINQAFGTIRPKFAVLRINLTVCSINKRYVLT